MGTPALEIITMTRTSFVAALALSPLMVHAQASLPVQPQAATSAPVLQAGLIQANGLLMLGGAAEPAAATPGTVRVSTGVTAPKLIHMVQIVEDSVPVSRLTGGNRTAEVSMIVDEKGKPSNLKIVKSAGSDLDREILSAVSQFRYQPGSVSGQLVSVPVELEVVVKETAE
jgi:TonB family protein